MRLLTACLTLSLIVLTGCEIYPPTPRPDYTIGVVKTSKGLTAIPPQCPSWATNVANPYDNQPLPQFGCANARNLALMTEQPGDLVRGRTLGPTSGVTMVGAMRRYNNNQTRGLIYVSPSVNDAVDVTTAPTSASSMTGEAAGGPSTGSSSGSSSGP